MIFDNCVSPLSVLAYLLNKQSTINSCSEIFTTPMIYNGELLKQYWYYFVLTLLLEAPFFYFLLNSLRPILRLSVIFFVNLATHPFIFLILPQIMMKFNKSYLFYLIVAETFAPIVEALLLIKVWKISPKKAFAISLIANLCSWMIGSYLG